MFHGLVWTSLVLTAVLDLVTIIRAAKSCLKLFFMWWLSCKLTEKQLLSSLLIGIWYWHFVICPNDAFPIFWDSKIIILSFFTNLQFDCCKMALLFFHGFILSSGFLKNEWRNIFNSGWMNIWVIAKCQVGNMNQLDLSGNATSKANGCSRSWFRWRK